MKKVIKLILCTGLLVACKPARPKDPVVFAQQESNGMRKEVRVGNMHFSIQYKPAAYILAQEHPDAAELKRRSEQLKGMAWFNITFDIPGFGESPLRYQVGGLDDYTARQDYFLNRAAGDISLCYGRDTLAPETYWFENNQNLTPHETMVVGFRLPASDSVPGQDMLLSYYDRTFRSGIIKALIRKEDL